MRTATIYFTTLLFFSAFGQSITSTILEHNDAAAYIPNHSGYFYGDQVNNIHYEIPKGDGINSIFFSQLWFAGLDQNNQLRMMLGDNQVNFDVFNGPISNPGTYNLPSYQSTYSNSIWEICQSEIDAYLTWWEACAGPNATAQSCQSATVPNNTVLDKLYGWPAHGDVSLGQNYWLAPYFDNPNGPNGADGMYNPSDGDVPIIKGCCAVYLIKNDAAQTHTYSMTDSMGIELQLMFYQYQTWNFLNNVTFLEVKAINRSSESFSDFAHGIYLDSDLGNYSDDLFGSDSSRSLMYFYNGDNNDETDGVHLGYGLNPPAFGVVNLDIQANSIQSYYSANSNVEKWHMMHGLSPNGTPMLDPNNNPTKFIYSGNPNNSGTWSAYEMGIPGNDVRGLSCIETGNFNPGDTVIQTYAFIFAREGNYLENVNYLKDVADQVKDFYENEPDKKCNGATLDVNELETYDFAIYPNPSQGVFTIDNEQQMEYLIRIYNIHGKLIKEFISNNKSIQLNIANNERGIYTLSIECDSFKKVKKVVIQ